MPLVPHNNWATLRKIQGLQMGGCIMAYSVLLYCIRLFSISLGSFTDYIPILPVDIDIEGNNTTIIELYARNDAVTLEYDDDVLLLFTPEDSNLIELYESKREYIRDRMTVRIIDQDRKQGMIGWLPSNNQ